MGDRFLYVENAMSDRTEEEEERYIRRVARRMPVHPERLLDYLRPLGFVVIYANRDEGINEINYLRTTPGLPDFFDIANVKSNIHGNGASLTIYQSIIPAGHECPCVKAVDEYVPATRYGYDREFADFRHASDSKRFERRVAEAIPTLFSELFHREGKALYNSSRPAREGAERYLAAANPDVKLVETLGRLKASASDEQWKQSQHYVQNELLSAFNVENFKLIWDIAGLCQVLFWERNGVPYRGLGGATNYIKATADDIEAHRRFQIVASRLARQPGWPAVDPLVPNRTDPEEHLLWREGRPPRVAELIDDHLAASDRQCKCGKKLYYVNHKVRGGSQQIADVLARCNNGHEVTIEMAGIG
jgi:hypothetical protein